MALLDFRRWLDVRDRSTGRDASVMLEVVSPGEVILTVISSSGNVAEVRVSDSDAGAVFDALAQAIGASVNAHAAAQLPRSDTPTEPGSQ